MTLTLRAVKGFIEELSAHCAKSAGKIASIVGRFYAMDRDKRWERVKEAYDLLVNGTGKKATDMVQAMQESYDEGVTDEFIKPISNANFDGTIKEGDVVYEDYPRTSVLLYDSIRCFIQGCTHPLP